MVLVHTRHLFSGSFIITKIGHLTSRLHLPCTVNVHVLVHVHNSAHSLIHVHAYIVTCTLYIVLSILAFQ